MSARNPFAQVEDADALRAVVVGLARTLGDLERRRHEAADARGKLADALDSVTAWHEAAQERLGQLVGVQRAGGAS